MDIINYLSKCIAGKKYKIVFPEGEDIRVLGAVSRLRKDGIIVPIILGKPDVITNIANNNGINIDGIVIINPDESNHRSVYKKEFFTLRKGKANLEQSALLTRDVNYFGAMMVQTGDADGMVSGATHTTRNILLPALQIIKTKPNTSKVSSAMLMISPNQEKYIFSDIAVNINLEPREMAEVAIESAKTAKMFGMDPFVAMLSFSTNGSANSAETEKTKKATEIARQIAPGLSIDGEMQFDTAFVESIGKKKMPNSKVAGKANVMIFPDIQSGNIGYKMAQYLGGYEALGPILQGLNKPINDLSRGCSEDDIYKIAIITAMQKMCSEETNIDDILN
jgi:phosphate acetyltransferase